jgi:hypothetical protein
VPDVVVVTEQLCRDRVEKSRARKQAPIRVDERTRPRKAVTWLWSTAVRYARTPSVRFGRAVDQYVGPNRRSQRQPLQAAVCRDKTGTASRRRRVPWCFAAEWPMKHPATGTSTYKAPRSAAALQQTLSTRAVRIPPMAPFVFIPPSQSDSRSPCPALNTLCNEGVL